MGAVSYRIVVIVVTIPLTKKNYNKELKYIRKLAIENGFNKQIIQKLIRKQRKTRNIHSTTKNRN